MEDKRLTTDKAGTGGTRAGGGGGTLSNKHRFLVHTSRALAELAVTRPRGRRKRITEQPNQTLSLFQKDLGAGQSECRQNKSSII